MKAFRYILGLIAAFTAIIALLVGSIEIAAFSSRGFYERQYEKNNVLASVGMEMEDLMEVTDYMLDYLQGKQEVLSVTTTMWGQERDFFNDRERAHMADVAQLNINAITVMWCCAASSVICLGALAASFVLPRRRPEHDFLSVLCRCVITGTLVFIFLLGIGAVIVSADFDHYWRIFHRIFFTNDLWLLDPSTDMLINIVPLNFFIALVARCALLFLFFILILLVPSVIYLVTIRRKRRRRRPHLPPSLYLSLLMVCSLALSLAAPTDCLSEEDILGLETAPEISADAAILIERSTGTVLYSKNAEKSEFPASTTKVMTALLTLENCNLEETVDFTRTAIYALTPGASHIGMTVGEQLTVSDCLYGLLLPSANEVANALAEHVSGSMPAFVELMNKRAAELGCTNTHFSNPNGLHEADHTTCARDLALIFQACLSTPNFIRIDSTKTYVIDPTNLVDESRPMKTTHRMLQSDSSYYDSRVICGKTGHTPEAGGCLITYAESNGLELICVVMNAAQPGEYEDTKRLLDYGFSSFSMTSALDLNQLTGTNDGICPSFYTSSQIPLYKLSDTQTIITSDRSLMSYTLEKNEEQIPVMVHLQAGNLALSSVPLEPVIQEDNPLTLQGFPASYIQTMEKAGENYLPIIILCAVLALALVLIYTAVRNTPERILSRRQKTTRIFKNVNLKKIKIK